MFDKTAYWKNRKNGKRGQGELESPRTPKRLVDKNGHWVGKKRQQWELDEATESDDFDGQHMVRTPKGFQRINRKQSRQKMRDRYYRPKRKVNGEWEEDHVGKPFTAKGVKPNPQKKPKFELRLDPTLSNKQRLHLREARRQMIREDERKANNG